MIKRCYSEKYQETHKTYIGVIICDEWKTYSKFKEWYISNYKDGYELDKDLIDGNKKMYSPETCSFVPNEINMCIIDKNNKNQPLGVCYHIPKKNMSFEYKKPYYAQIYKNKKKYHLGAFPTPEEAHTKWQLAKKEHLSDIIKKYNNSVSDGVIKGLQRRIDVLNDDLLNGRITLSLSKI